MASGARDQHAKPRWTRSSGGKQAGSLIAAVRGAPEAVPERRGGERRGAADVLLEVADVGGLSANSTLHLVKVAQLNGGQGHKIKRNAFKVPVYWSHTDFLRGRGLSEGRRLQSGADFKRMPELLQARVLLPCQLALFSGLCLRMLGDVHVPSCSAAAALAAVWGPFWLGTLLAAGQFCGWHSRHLSQAVPGLLPRP